MSYTELLSLRERERERKREREREREKKKKRERERENTPHWSLRRLLCAKDSVIISLLSVHLLVSSV